jgi:hypothetical protein
VGPDATFPEVKAEFYADAYGLSEETMAQWMRLGASHPPYGLATRTGTPIERIRTPGGSEYRGWLRLEGALSDTATYAFENTRPGNLNSCPYAAVLRKSVGILGKGAQPVDNDEFGLDTFRSRTLPGAQFAPTTIVGLMRAMGRLKQLHGAKSSSSILAQNSARSLLSEPLYHAQQWAKPFIFTLGKGDGVSDGRLQRDTFLDDDTAERYTKLEVDGAGNEIIAWSMPTEDFALRVAVRVADRTRGHETEPGDHQRVYPAGTRLGDIEVTEPTIKCPGFRLAYAMWNTAVMVAAEENLWADETAA